jgi:acyl-coenzyme A thioesterase PaaI-like protein
LSRDCEWHKVPLPAVTNLPDPQQHPEGRLISTEEGAARAQIDWLTPTPPALTSTAVREFSNARHCALANWHVTRATRARAPLLAALQVRFEELRPGLCRAAIDVHPRVRTADGSIDSLAVGALAQLAATMVMEVSAPASMLWWSRGLTIEHLRRGESVLIALARLDKTEWSEDSTVVVPVTVRDDTGSEVARAVISFASAVQTS